MLGFADEACPGGGVRGEGRKTPRTKGNKRGRADTVDVGGGEGGGFGERCDADALAEAVEGGQGAESVGDGAVKAEGDENKKRRKKERKEKKQKKENKEDEDNNGKKEKKRRKEGKNEEKKENNEVEEKKGKKEKKRRK